MTVFGYFYHKEFEIPLEAARDCSAQGPVDDAVAYWAPKIDLSNYSREEKIRGLVETGGWTREELEKLDDSELDEKILWITSCDLKEEGALK